MKKSKYLLLLMAGFASAALLTACDVSFDGPGYHFKMVNRTRGTIKNVEIVGGGSTWNCGTMTPERSCTVPYMSAPATVTVSYASNSEWGYQGTLSQVFTTDSSQAFDEQNLYLDNGYFTMEMENRTTDDFTADPKVDYQVTGFKVVDFDGAVEVDEYNFAANIDNDGETYFLGFFDRYDPDAADPADTTGKLQIIALVVNTKNSSNTADWVAEAEADWTSGELQMPSRLFELGNEDGKGYYVKVDFLARNNIFYDTYSTD